MLEPDTRTLLLDALRPPEGWELGHALGTTFTLDLQALLIAPLAFAMFDWALDEDGRADPIAILEALRRYADRTTVFHQAGMVTVPTWQPLFVHLEQCVVPVTPPNPNAIFHPKVWLLQFTNDGHDPRYRLLSLSRNLTFDTSWDTVVSLDGDRRLKSEQSGELADWLGDIVRSASQIDNDRRSTLLDIAQDVRFIRFDPPENVDQVRFHGFGYGDKALPFPTRAERSIVISPFAGADLLDRVALGESPTIISRPETIDEIGADALAAWDKTMVMSSEILEDDVLGEDQPIATKDDTPDEAAVLKGLHAKVFAFEREGITRLFTGSANATGAAFNGNVEFLVEMRGEADKFPITTLLDGPEGVTTFGDLCSDYTPAPKPETDPSRALNNLLERAQRVIGALDFEAHVEQHDEGFLLELRSSRAPKLPDGITGMHCWRITAGQGHQVTPHVSATGLTANFGRVAYDGLTSFFAFEVAGTHAGGSDRVRFVVNAKLIGAPEDRAETVIARLLKNRDDLLRYLLFLLSDTGTGIADLFEGISAIGTGNGAGRDPFGGSGLMETLLRALVRDPAKLDHVGKLLADLDKAGRRADLVPEGLDQLWAAIAEVRADDGDRPTP